MSFLNMFIKGAQAIFMLTAAFVVVFGVYTLIFRIEILESMQIPVWYFTVGIITWLILGLLWSAKVRQWVKVNIVGRLVSTLI